MSRSSAKAISAARASFDWALRELDQYADGVHTLGDPAYMFDSEIPEVLAELFRRHDGIELFHESVVLLPSRKVRKRDGAWPIGTALGDELEVTPDGRVWRFEEDLGVNVVDGSSVDRWLVAQVAAFALLYDRQGEFRDGVIDEFGDLSPAAAKNWHQTVVDRDRSAPAPRRRLARCLAQEEAFVRAREMLEEAVALDPKFAWAWYDLGRTAEALGDFRGAYDEYLEAGDVAVPSDLAGYFAAQAARVARDNGWESERSAAAASAIERSPQVVSDQLAGARELLELGDHQGAAELARTASALAPKNLDVLALLRGLEPPAES